MNAKRSYTMTTRARSAEETRRRILQAAFDLQGERLSAEISLDDVSSRAEVSVQTVLRHFGTRAGLFDAAVAWANERVADERRTPAGDVPAAIRVLVGHYEQRGDMALMMLAQESTYEHVRKLSDAGKHMHRGWVADVFAPYLTDHGGARREELLDLLVVATDVYTWKLLRRDRALSRKDTEKRIETLVAAILPAAGAEEES